MLSRKNLIVLFILIFTGVSLYYFGSQNTTSQDSEKTLELTTVKISKGDLSKKEEYSGTLSQVDKSILNSSITGVVTYLPEEGAIINFGQVLYAVDNKPVILLQGSIPFYRTLDLNSDDGPDIKQIEEALVDLGYSEDGFTPDENFDETTSQMLNNLYIDYGIETKSEITPTEQVAINAKKEEIEAIEETIASGGVTLAQVNDKKKKLDEANEAATEENAAWKAADASIEASEQSLSLLRDETNPETKEKKAAGTLDAEIEDLEQSIEKQKRIKALEEGKESGVDATEALAIETAQKAYDDALEAYNEGVDEKAELEKAKEELQDLELAAKSETFSPTNAYASDTELIVGTYINKVGGAITINGQIYNTSSTGVEVFFWLPAADQDTVTLGEEVEVELPTDERVNTVIKFIDQVVTETQAGNFIQVKLDVLNSAEIEVYDQAPVKVFVVTEVSEDVLYVPVNALLALAEGGYAVEIYNGDPESQIFKGESGIETTYVGVEIGVFTDGFVEIIGNIKEGQLVVVPR